MILGASGTGKSSLALHLISLGAALVSDDRTIINEQDGLVFGRAPKTIEGLIEARGVGLLRLSPAGPTPIGLVVNLDKEETKRLPDPHSLDLLGITLPCLWRTEGSHFAPAILLWLKGGIGVHQ